MSDRKRTTRRTKKRTKRAKKAPPRNEYTSPDVASIAGRVLAALAKHSEEACLGVWIAGVSVMTLDELRALAASALTQAKDKQR